MIYKKLFPQKMSLISVGFIKKIQILLIKTNEYSLIWELFSEDTMQ